jgi:hypothetical protein
VLEDSHIFWDSLCSSPAVLSFLLSEREVREKRERDKRERERLKKRDKMRRRESESPTVLHCKLGMHMLSGKTRTYSILDGRLDLPHGKKSYVTIQNSTHQPRLSPDVNIDART